MCYQGPEGEPGMPWCEVCKQEIINLACKCGVRGPDGGKEGEIGQSDPYLHRGTEQEQ